MCPPRCFSSLLLSHPRHCCRCCWVAKLHPTLVTPPGSSVHGISQARIPEWVAIFPSGGSSRPRDGTRVLLGSQTLCHWAAWEAPPHPQGENKNKWKARLEAGILGEGGGHELVSQKTAHFRHMNVFKVLIIAYTPRVPLKRERPIHTAAEGEDLDDLGLWSQGCRPFPSPQPHLPLGNC